ncbi:MAG: hypothetical protein FD176_2422 [Rhodospirillaceae bacterium]|nr:MAG: hypothetical protein FD176_2422 [Rhodospirillaceae bacterium]TNC98097.1 MAG: hypothetical protein FD119_580 [Stygiobacter sp.]
MRGAATEAHQMTHQILAQEGFFRAVVQPVVNALETVEIAGHPAAFPMIGQGVTAERTAGIRHGTPPFRTLHAPIIGRKTA